jgi:TonB-linked SusC/RagA family outer membrane protein
MKNELKVGEYKTSCSHKFKSVTIVAALSLILSLCFVVPSFSANKTESKSAINQGIGLNDEMNDALQQTRTITGKVVDEEGATLPGVSVVAKGTTKGTVTDIDGGYSLSVPDKVTTIVFSFVGKETIEEAINNRAIINVTLHETKIDLNEVVVVGYGVQKKSDITGSITSVNVETLRDVPASDITKALQGKTAGVEIQNISSRPGSDTQIRIRGNRSLSASNDPLIIVDGIPFGGNISDISSDDIASIEILKDASATVIYGSRGSNGVIIITTKRGEAGKFRVTYNGYQGVSTVARKFDVFNAEEFINLRTAAGYNDYLPDEKQSMLLGRETDWQDLIYQDGVTSNHELNISGGTESAQYSFSGGYFNESGVLPFMNFERYSMRMSIDQKIGKYIKIGLSSMNNFAITNGQSANPMYVILTLDPLTVPYNYDGTVKEQPSYPIDDYYNPITLGDSERWKEQNRRASSFNSLYGEVEIFKGFKYRLNVGLEFYQNKYDNFYGSNTPVRSGSKSTASVRNKDNLSFTIENLLIYDKTFAEKHRINFTGLYSIQESTTTSSRLDGTNIPADYLQYNNISLAEIKDAPANDNYYQRWSLMSFMGRINYVYNNKYMLTITGRSDGSSRLAPGNKWHSYPALALGWNIMNENFMKNQDFLSILKLRLGYGQTSNTSIDPYRTLGGLSATKYSFGDAGVNGYYVNTMPNYKLGWEYTSTTNIGLDFGIFKNRLSGSIDVYQQKTTDLLLGKSLPPSIGVPGSYIENIGETQNKGLEVALNWMVLNPSKTNGFTWEINTNLFLNREKIVALQDTSITKDIGNGWFVGEPTTAIYDYVKIGIWQLGEEEAAAVYNAKPGDIKLKDFAGGGANGDEPDGKITDADRKVLGSAQADVIGGFTSTWEFKGFDLSVVGYYKIGGMIISSVHAPNAYFNRLDGRRNGPKVDYWTPENPTNDMPQPNVNIVTDRSNVLAYFDGSFLKIRSINLGYNFDKKLTQFLGKNSSIRIYATVTDPFIFFSPYLKAGGVDPEPTNTALLENGAFRTGGVPNSRLVVGWNTPPTTKYIFGINVKF